MTTRPTLLAEIPTVAQTRAAVAKVREAGTAYALAIAMEQSLLRSKPERKMAAIRRLMARENPLIPGKSYTCSAAEAVAETDPVYFAFGQQLTDATCQRELAWVEVVAARLEAQLELSILLADDDHDDSREPTF